MSYERRGMGMDRSVAFCCARGIGAERYRASDCVVRWLSNEKAQAQTAATDTRTRDSHVTA